MQDCPFCHSAVDDTVVTDGICPACKNPLAQTTETFAMPESVGNFWSQSSEEVLPATPSHSSHDSDSLTSRTVIKSHVVADAATEAKPASDYELIKILGEGGMGVVYEARQTSVDRTIALKMLKSGRSERSDARAKFLSEAVVTGDLNHPNIVPIYDLGTTDSGVLFYAMKQVKGVAWKAVIRQKTRNENLEILMRVADAVAFAHSRGVIHRDLKPENIMLGDYGEVLVMDWGMAVSITEIGKAERAVTSRGVGGTPAYMAPEMAVGDIEKIGAPTDIYLLGAILFEVITGKPPHAGRAVTDMLEAAAANRIVPVSRPDELSQIAVNAMAGEPADRFADVKEFQAAIGTYLSHAESIALSTAAANDLARARETKGYDDYAGALFGFKEALKLWGSNRAAADGEATTRLAYGRNALKKADLDLAESLLLPDMPEHKRLLDRVNAVRRMRAAQKRRQRFVVAAARVLVACVVVTLAVAFFWVRSEKENVEAARISEKHARIKAEEAGRVEAELRQKEADLRNKWKAAALAEAKQHKLAVDARKAAEDEKKKAEREKERAIRAEARAQTEKDGADEARRKAEVQQAIAEAARDEAEADKEKFIAERKAKIEQQKKTDEAMEEAENQRQIALQAEADSEKARQQIEKLNYFNLILRCTGLIKKFDFFQAKKELEKCPVRYRGWEWGRLHHLCSLKSLVLAGHKGAITSIAFSPDGKLLLTGSRDGTARIWNSQTGRQLRILSDHQEGTRQAAFLPGGKRVLTAAGDGRIRVWDFLADDGRVAQTRLTVQAPGKAVQCIVVSSDVSTAVACWQNGTASLWDIETGMHRLRFIGHTAPIMAAAVSVDKNLVATAGADRTAMLWQTRGDLAMIDLNIGPNAIRVWDDGTGRGRVDTKPAILDDSGAIPIIVNLDTPPQVDASTPVMTAILTLQEHRDTVNAVAFSPDAMFILTGSNDTTTKLWSRNTGRVVKTLPGHAGVSTVAFFPDGRRVVSGYNDGTVILWDAGIGIEIMSLKGHNGAITAIVPSADGSQILTASIDGTARLWDTRKYQKRIILQGHTKPVLYAAFDPLGRYVITGSADALAKAWNAKTGEKIMTMSEQQGPIYRIIVAPDGRRVLTASRDRTVMLWDMQTQKFIKTMDNSNDRIDLDAFFQQTERPRHPLPLARATNPGHPGKADDETAPVYSPDGRYYVTGINSRTARLHDAWAGRKPKPLSGHTDVIYAVGFSPDGTRIVTGAGDDTAKLWDVETGLELMALEGHGGAIRWVGFSPDSRRIITCSDDRTAIVWNSDQWAGTAGE